MKANKPSNWDARIEVETTTHKNLDGRCFIQFAPVLKPDCCAQGELRFAVWHVWEDEPDTHEAAKAKAIASAKSVLAGYATNV